ncbi:protein LSM14 homolog A-like isoform X3 [Eupeodes corollae]|uniref:protein LSM14 homolog A-like isoform X3 n=1 Tax=Eupeodes corollae TaxID=290404 RepID=UPI002491719E|nr:protein LSM14 homolog A-like isoform X3 [Eupeodes corollae]
MTSGGGMPELGSKISLISKADIRYEGRLYTVDPNECTIALSSVRSFGTEDRETQFQIAPQSQIYDYILFRGSDIKDIRVVNNGMPHPNDPAIMQVQLPNGQHLMPHFPMQTMNPPMGNYGNPFGAMGGLGGIGASSATATGLAPGSFMLNKPKQPSELNDALPQEFNLMAINNSSTAAPPNAPSTSAAEHKDQVSVLDLLAGASRSTTPISLISRKSPSADLAVQVNQQQQQQHNNNTGNNRDAGHKRQNHQQQRGGNNTNNNTGNGNNGGNRNDGGVGGGGGGGGGYFQRDRRDSGRLDNQHNNYNNHDNRNHYNNQRNQNQNQNSRGWTMNRGNNNTNNNNMRNRGRGRLPNQGYRQMSGNPSKNNRPKNTIKFEQDFDFEQANNKFEELRSQLAKLKVGDEPKAEQINGETDKKDDSGNETGAGEHEPEDEEITVGYDKTKSFFDNISCEAADRSKNKKVDWRQERKLNNETFGIAYSRHGSYRGRGNYYNRNMNNYGGYNRGYRGGNYNNRNRNNNNRIGQQNIQNNPQKNQNMQQPQSQPQNKNSQETNNTPTQVAAVVAAKKTDGDRRKLSDTFFDH